MKLIRPDNIKTTPNRLGNLLGADIHRISRLEGIALHHSSDFYMAYPSPERHNFRSGTIFNYELVYEFYILTKFGQRRYLRNSGIETPLSWNSPRSCPPISSGPLQKYVVRPLRHSGGRNYRITSNYNDFEPGNEYCSQVIPKDREYRIIFVKGDPIIWMRKKNPNNIPPELAWNHTNGCFFQTINNIQECKIHNNLTLTRLQNCHVVKNASICAADIIWTEADGKAYVTEVNLCPGISLQGSLEKVVQKWNSLFITSRPVSLSPQPAHTPQYQIYSTH